MISPRQNDGMGDGFLPANNSDWKNINATMDWLQHLTPAVPYLSSTLGLNSAASTIANLLMSTEHTQIPPIGDVENGCIEDEDGVRPYSFWEFVVAAYFAEGVARVGYAKQTEFPGVFIEGSSPGSSPCNGFIPAAWHNHNVCPESRPRDANLTAFSLRGQNVGGMFLLSHIVPFLWIYASVAYRTNLIQNTVYAYRASAITDFVSIAIVSIYICIATAHLLYCLIRRRSSRAWENLEDLLALAHSSRPEPKLLSNICAGIENPSTRAKSLMILSRVSGAEGESDKINEETEGIGRENFVMDEEEMQLVYMNSIPNGTVFEKVEADSKYGKME